MIPSSCAATATAAGTGKQVDHADDPTNDYNLGLDVASFSALDDSSNFNMKEPTLRNDPPNDIIPSVKEEQEEVKGKERLSTGGESDFYNSTTLILSPSFSRYHERRLVDVTTIAWSLATSSASWSGRSGHSSVALDSNTIVLMGGDTSSSK